MNSITAAFIRTSRSIRRATTNLLNRLTRKASLKLAVTVSLPPFVKFAIDYKADLSKPEIGIPKPANDNPRRSSRSRA
jgi:hypothetical protein